MNNARGRITNVQKTSISAQAYHALTRISASGLRTILTQSLRHFRYEIEHKAEPTPAMEFGTAYHAMLLEPEKFEQQYAIFDTEKRPDTSMTMAAKANTAWKDKFYADAETSGKSIIKKADYNIIADMGMVLMSNPDIEGLLSGGDREPTFIFEIDEVLGKARMDYVLLRGGKTVIVDLKTTTDASPRAFGNTAFKMRYHVQAAFYTDILAAYLGTDPDDIAFIFIAQEKDAPYVAQAYEVPLHVIRQGRDEYLAALEAFQYADENNAWRGYEDVDRRGGLRDLWFPEYGFQEVTV